MVKRWYIMRLMNKARVLSGLAAFFLTSALFSGVALANEGVFRLAGKADSDGRCFGVSVYVDNGYKVLMTCRGLKMALDPVINRYVAWAVAGDTTTRLGEIVAGKLQANIDSKFDKVTVTLEQDAYAQTPTANPILAANIEAIDFGKELNSSLTQTPTPTPKAATNQNILSPLTQNQTTATVTPAQANTAGTTLTSVVAGVGKAILLGFVLLLVVVGVMGFLARRKSL